MSEQTIDQADELARLTVEYWRKRYRDVRPKFGTLTELHEILSQRDEEFAGVRGYQRLRNVQVDLGGLEITAKAVLLMERAPQKPPANDDVAQLLKRQGLQRVK